MADGTEAPITADESIIDGDTGTANESVSINFSDTGITGTAEPGTGRIDSSADSRPGNRRFRFGKRNRNNTARLTIENQPETPRRFETEKIESTEDSIKDVSEVLGDLSKQIDKLFGNQGIWTLSGTETRMLTRQSTKVAAQLPNVPAINNLWLNVGLLGAMVGVMGGIRIYQTKQLIAAVKMQQLQQMQAQMQGVPANPYEHMNGTIPDPMTILS